MKNAVEFCVGSRGGSISFADFGGTALATRLGGTVKSKGQKKTSTDLSEELLFFKSGAAKKADPTARWKPGFALIEKCAAEQHYRMARGTWGISATSTVGSAISLSIKSVDRVLRRRNWAEGLSYRERERLDALESLLAHDPSQADLIEAMDFGYDALRKLRREFSVAEFEEPLPESETSEDRLQREYDRYRCAALLALLVSLIKRVWLPVRERMQAQR